jgi:hypothetical protein
LGWLQAPRGAHNTSLVSLKAQLLGMANPPSPAWVQAIKNAVVPSQTRSWTIKAFSPKYTNADLAETWRFQRWASFLPISTPHGAVAKIDEFVKTKKKANLDAAWPPGSSTTPRAKHVAAWSLHGAPAYGNMLDNYFSSVLALRKKYHNACAKAFAKLGKHLSHYKEKNEKHKHYRQIERCRLDNQVRRPGPGYHHSRGRLRRELCLEACHVALSIPLPSSYTPHSRFVHARPRACTLS